MSVVCSTRNNKTSKSKKLESLGRRFSCNCQAKACTLNCSDNNSDSPNPQLFVKFEKSLADLLMSQAHCPCDPNTFCSYCSSIEQLIEELSVLRTFHPPKFTPPARLVCIETNPGPKTKVKNTITTVAVVPKNVVKVVTTTINNKKKKRKSKRNRSGIPSSITGCSDLDLYIKSLNDPFEYPGVRLGFGCMVPTMLATAYYRGLFYANSTDGSFGITMQPSLGSLNQQIYYNNTGAGSGSWTSLSFPNAGVISNQINEARAISFGIRVLPLVADTAVPGVVYCGSIASSTNAQINTVSLTTCSTFPQLEFGDSRMGAVALGRPSDLTAYAFNSVVDQGLSSSLSPWSVPLIVILGLPPTTPIMVELVLNMECLQGATSVNAQIEPSIGGVPDNVQPTLSDYLPSLDSLWSATKNHITAAANFGTQLSGVKVGDTTLGGLAASGANRAAMAYFNNHGAGRRAQHRLM
jgi:hypothetical protein